MKRYALIGRRLGHSYSQQWFGELFARLGLADHRYDLHEMDSLAALHPWVEHEGIAGFNVTVPYKQEVIAYLDTLDETAMAVGAVNCVTVEHGRLVGHNTDAPAFRRSLEATGWKPRRALILGTGGAAHAVALALNELSIHYIYISRTTETKTDEVSLLEVASYEQIPLLCSQKGTLIVNATPVGMFPDEESSPIPVIDFPLSYVYDLTYNPSPTRLMRDALAAGAEVKDGMEMLHLQAEMSWQLFQQATDTVF